MLTQVDVQSENPFFMKIRDARPSDSIRVEKIDGLGPPSVDLFMGDYARDGGTYNGRRVPPRTVTFTLSLNPNYKLGETVDGLRKLLYKSFMDPFPTFDAVNIILHDDTVADRFLQGHVGKFEPDIFSDDTTCQIEMRCPNPYIQDSDITEFTPTGPTYPFTYEGSAETGLMFEADVTVSTGIVTFDLNGLKFFLEYDFHSGDHLIVDTRRGFRRIQVVRTVSSIITTTDILYAKRADSIWPELHSVSNTLKIYGATTSNIVGNLTDISFRALHWGI